LLVLGVLLVNHTLKAIPFIKGYHKYAGNT